MEKELIAHDLAHNAARILKGNFCANLCKSLNSRRTESLEKYKQAAIMFKSVQKWEEAGECYEKCGQINQFLESVFTSDYEESAYCYGMVNKNKKEQSQINNILLKLYEKNANFSSAGKLTFQIAEEMDKNNEFNNAIENYLKSADYYSMEGLNNTKQRQNDSLIKAADLICVKEYKDVFIQATQIYEKVGNDYYNTPLLQGNARTIFFKIVSLNLAYKDITTAENCFNTYSKMDPGFVETIYWEFLTEAIQAIKKDSVQEFKLAVTRLHKSNSLDNWKIAIFTLIQKKFNEGKPYENLEITDQYKEINWQ